MLQLPEILNEENNEPMFAYQKNKATDLYFTKVTIYKFGEN